MTRARDIIFCCVVVLLLCVGIVYRMSAALGKLPDVLANSSYSYLEGVYLQEHPEFSFSSFSEGTFQNETEDYLSASFPARNATLVANATRQRLFIKLAGLPFSYTTYPTFHGSDYVYDETSSSLFERPETQTDYLAERYAASVSALSALQAENPDIEMLVYIPDRSLTTDANPAMALMAHPLDSAYVAKMLVEPLEAAGVTCLTDIYGNIDAYHERYFLTDHHWTIQGAYEAYLHITETLGIEPLAPQGEVSYPEYTSYGSSARIGLDLVKGDFIRDYVFDLPAYQLLRDGEPVEGSGTGKDDFAAGDAGIARASYNAYAYYFGTYYDLETILVPENAGSEDDGGADASGGGSSDANSYGDASGSENDVPEVDSIDSERSGRKLLIIGDSFTEPLELLFAASFAETHIIDPRKYEGSLSAYMAEHDFDTVIVLAATNTLVGKAVVAELEN